MDSLELKRAQNREKQRNWRLKNLERSKELKRLSNYKARGYVPTMRVAPKTGHRAVSGDNFTLRSTKDYTIEVDLCLCCGRKYLTKLYCLWCTKK